MGLLTNGFLADPRVGAERLRQLCLAPCLRGLPRRAQQRREIRIGTS